MAAPASWRTRRRVFLGGALALLGAGPLCAYAGTGPTVLVLADDGTRLLALDATTLRVVRELSLPGGPWRRLLTPPGGYSLLVADDGAVARVAPGAAALLAQRPGSAGLSDAALGDGGRLLMLAGRAPATLTLLDAGTLQVLKTWPLVTVDGRTGMAGAEVHDAPARRSFVVAPADLPELWEISCDPHAEDQYEGLVHDFRMGEGVPVRGYLHARRTRLPQPLAQLLLDEDGLLVVGAAPGQPLQGYNLDARRRAAVWPAHAALRPRAGSWLRRGEQAWLAVPDAEQPLLHWLHPEGLAAPPPLALPAPARWVRPGGAGAWLWAASGDTLLRVDASRATVETVLSAGPVIDLREMASAGEAIVLTGGDTPALHRLDLASARPAVRRPLRGPVAMALELPTRTTPPP